MLKIDPKHIAERILQRHDKIEMLLLDGVILDILEEEYNLITAIIDEMDSLTDTLPRNEAEDKERRGEF